MAQLSRLTQLHLKISDNLTEEDVRNLRSLLAVDEILGKGKTEKVTPLEIFNMLVDNDTIGKGNLGWLVQVLRCLGKGELANEAERLEQEQQLDDLLPPPTELRGPEMARVYEEACRQGSLSVHSTRVPVVGQFRSGKTCFINRLMGEPVREDEPVTDGIQITSDVQTKTWKKSKEELDEFDVGMAGILLQTRQETGTLAEKANDSVEMSETLLAQPGNAEESKVVTSAYEITQSQNRKVPRTDVTAIPGNVVETAERMQKSGFTEDELGSFDHPRLSLWDFGGQATYYGTHHCFITHRGIYILVMSLLQKLSDPVPDLDYKASVDNLRTGGDYLDYWLNSIRSHSLHTRQPPVIIVLTHKDKVTQEYIGEYIEKIHGHIKDKAAGKLVKEKIFAVSNMTEDRTVDEIRDYVREVAKTLPHMGEEIPISWLHLNSKLKEKRKNGILFCKFQEIAKLARDPDIGIKDQHTLALVLTFLHDRGDVIYFDEPSLRDDVTLQPQVMIDVFKTIITVPHYQQDRQTDPKVRKMWERLEKDGVLSDELLTRIWEKKDQQLEKPFLLQHKSFLKALMEKFYLICNATPVGDANDEAQQVEIYFVPALLSCEKDNARLYSDKMFICPQALYFVFNEQFLPSGMFSRLQALCVRRFGLQESCVFAGCALFPTDDKEQAFVITKVKHYLKVELLSSSNVFSEGLRVRKFLSSALFEIKEKWIPCIQYELCCSTQQEDGSEPAFRTLPTEYRSLEQLWGIPPVFHAVWMPGTLQCDRTANSGGDGPVILQPLGDPDTIVGMRTIGPVLDTMEQGGGLTLDQCDHIRNQLTPIQRVKDMIRQGEVDSYQLGAAVEMCLPEFVDLFRREKRGKELVIIHADDYTSEFVLPLQTAAKESGLPCLTEVIAGTDSITEKVVKLLFNTNDRMVALVISPQTLHHKHWSNLDYEFPVRNQKLLLPILMYPKGSRDRMVRMLQQRSPVLFNMKRKEIQMEGGAVPEGRLQEIVHRVLFGSIFSPLDEAGVKSLSRVWSARTGKQESQEIETSQDLMKAMATTGYITAGEFEKVEKDMIAAGISFPVIARDNPGVPDEFQYQRSSTASVGTLGGKVEIPGFVELAVPPGALQTDTTITVSTVDIPRILCGPEGVSWTSGYPWSLGENAFPREVLDHVLFSPAVKVDLHGAQLSGPVELKTWRPPGSEGMECVLLKHHDGEGWKDITASTLHHIDSGNISVCLSALCTLSFVWAPEDEVEEVEKAMPQVLLSRTLACRFTGYIKLHKEGAEFHVVCRARAEDQSVKTDEYRHDFTDCGSNDAEYDLYDHDEIKVAVTVGGREGYDSSLSTPTEFPVTTSLQSGDGAGPSGIRIDSGTKGSGSNPIVLMLNDEYGTAKGGISATHRQMARFLVYKGAKVYSTVLEATEEDKADAKAGGVELIFPAIFEGDSPKASLDWLTWYHSSCYPNLPSDVDFIVGHVNITSRAARRIKENRIPDAKLVQVTHVIPEDTNHYKSTEKVQEIQKENASILEDLQDAHAVFSVGPRIHSYYTHQTKQVNLQHFEFLPKPSDIFIEADMKPPKDTAADTKVVLSIGRVKGVERLKGYDLSAQSMGDVIEELPNTKWRLCGIKKGDFERSQEIINANKGNFEFVPFTPLEYCTQEELCEEMGRADVVLMPSRSEPFGLVGLEAIAAGVPTVISSKSGLADFLKAQHAIELDEDFKRPIVEISGNDEEDAARLASRIKGILKNRGPEFKAAKRLKQKLLASEYWAESHRNFLQVFGLET
ncbi:uncharacterized protein LOC144919449 [Branchiostoma floridae x Branchiostoma belcheri]